jgi:hypothetical protein
MADSPFALRSGSSSPVRKSLAMSPPRLNVGSNSLSVRKISWSYAPGFCLGSI